MQDNIWNDENLIRVLKENGVVVMPTDTIYGIVARAENEEVVNRIYKIRKRNPEKPCIILISDIKELGKISIFPTEEQKNILGKYWPGPVSIILDCTNDLLKYLHRGTKTLAIRVPADKSLRNLLSKTGPLLAPSANIEELPVSKDVQEAQNYFKDLVDLYIDGGTRQGKASKLIKLEKSGNITVLRD